MTTALKKHIQTCSDAGERSQAGTPESHYRVSFAGDNAKHKAFEALHMDIQIYEMEPGVYLVDFKCSGYETPEGRVLEEKEVTSPFPFLDMAARLIMQLAESE